MGFLIDHSLKKQWIVLFCTHIIAYLLIDSDGKSGDSIEQFKSYSQKMEIRYYFLRLAQTILVKSPWNTLGISNQIKHVSLMWINMFNIGY